MDRNSEDVCTVADSTQALKDLIAKAEKRLATETRELALKRIIVDALPSGLCLVPVTLNAGGYKCDASIKFTMKRREEAVELLKQLPALDVVLLKGGCTSLIPKCRFDEELKTGQSVTDIAPVHFTFDGYGGGYSREHFTWWTQVGKHVVQVLVELDSKCAGVRAESSHERGFSGGISRARWHLSNIPAGCYIDWSSDVDERNPGRVTMYFEPEGDLAAKMLSQGTHNRSRTV